MLKEDTEISQSVLITVGEVAVVGCGWHDTKGWRILSRFGLLLFNSQIIGQRQLFYKLIAQEVEEYLTAVAL